MPVWCYSYLCKESFLKHRHSAIHELSSGKPCSNERKNIRYAHNILRSLNCGRIRNYISILRMFLETSSLCYPRTLFRHALFELAEKYRIVSQYTQIVKLWENSKQHTEWVALQRKARVFSADERCFGNSSRWQYNSLLFSGNLN